MFTHYIKKFIIYNFQECKLIKKFTISRNIHNIHSISIPIYNKIINNNIGKNIESYIQSNINCPLCKQHSLLKVYLDNNNNKVYQNNINNNTNLHEVPSTDLECIKCDNKFEVKSKALNETIPGKGKLTYPTNIKIKGGSYKYLINNIFKNNLHFIIVIYGISNDISNDISKNITNNIYIKDILFVKNECFYEENIIIKQGDQNKYNNKNWSNIEIKNVNANNIISLFPKNNNLSKLLIKN